MSNLADSLLQLREMLVATDLPLDIGDAQGARVVRDELVGQVDDYALPRLASLDAPLLLVIGGSTGAGKSTITNTLVGAEVSAAGVLRPTTRTPVLVCHPDDNEWFSTGGILPDLARSTGERGVGAGLHIVTSVAVPSGVGILDSPDIDSIEVANHDLAAKLLGAADLWLFVTTAARYADAVPWEYLARAKERAIALSVVINRIPAGAEQQVGTHLESMLTERGLQATKLFLIPETTLGEGLIPDTVQPIQQWLGALVASDEERDALVRTTLDGVLDSVPARVERIAAAVQEQGGGAEALSDHALARYRQALTEIERQLDSGNLLQGEVLEAWTSQVGTGRFMDGMQRTVGRVRDRIKSALTGSNMPEAQVQGQLESNLSVLVREAADAAALDIVESWEALPGGRQVLAGADRGLDRSSPDVPERMAVEIDKWQQGVIELVSEQAGSKLALARTLSLGVNSLGVTLMVAVFSQTGGVTGGEAAIAGGTAAVSQAVLSAIFGEQAVRDLARTSRADLRERIGEVLDAELARFDLLLGPVPGPDESEALHAALDTLEAARS